MAGDLITIGGLGGDNIDKKREPQQPSFGDVPTQAEADIAEQISAIRKNKELIAEEKTNQIFQVVNGWFEAHGKFYSLGKKNGKGMAAWLNSETRELVEISPGSSRFAHLLQGFGIQPSTETAQDLGKNLGCKHGGSAPANTVYAMSVLKDGKLYLNQYDGTILRITVNPFVYLNTFTSEALAQDRVTDEMTQKGGTHYYNWFWRNGPDGPAKVEKLRNGDDDVLFNTNGDPLDCDIEYATNPVIKDASGEIIKSRDYALNLGANSLLEKYILNTVTYSDESIPKEQVKQLLCGWIIGLYFQEVIHVPFLLLVTGVPGAMKSSIIRNIGRVIIGMDFDVQPFPKDPDELKLLAVTHGFIGLDESNLTKEHEELLNTITTGGIDERRELYTTDHMRRKPFQARIAMTGNLSETRQESTSSRTLAVDVVKPEAAEPYMADTDVKEELRRHRNEIWTEIVVRCKNILVGLAYTKLPGVGRITHVSHRMSGYFIWYINAAKAESWEEYALKEMEAVAARQQRQVVEANDDFLSVIDAWQRACGDGMWRTAAEWAKQLASSIGDSNPALRAKVASTGYVQYKLKALEPTLRRDKYVMETRYDAHAKRQEYRFKKHQNPGAPQNGEDHIDEDIF